MTLAAIIVSLIAAMGSLVLVWRGLDGVPRAKMLQYGLIWAVIFLGVVLVLRLVGV